jgi:muconolactone delta-isomerase
MMEIELPYIKDEEYIALIPRQRDVLAKLLSTGIISSFSLNVNRTKAWMTIFASNEDHAMQIVENFPLYKFMSFEIFPLALTDKAPAAAPPLVMN